VVLEAASLCLVVGDEAKTSNNLKPKPRIISNRIKVLMLELEPVLRKLVVATVEVRVVAVVNQIRIKDHRQEVA
jgi:hypothetical protein